MSFVFIIYWCVHIHGMSTMEWENQHKKSSIKHLKSWAVDCFANVFTFVMWLWQICLFGHAIVMFLMNVSNAVQRHSSTKDVIVVHIVWRIQRSHKSITTMVEYLQYGINIIFKVYILNGQIFCSHFRIFSRYSKTDTFVLERNCNWLNVVKGQNCGKVWMVHLTGDKQNQMFVWLSVS